jgi:hypothetical protein
MTQQLPPAYYDSQGITLYQGDCLELLPLFPEEHFDMVFADPPYHLSDEDLTLQRYESDEGHWFRVPVAVAETGQPTAGALRRCCPPLHVGLQCRRRGTFSAGGIAPMPDGDRTWKDVVAQALAELGGEAHLSVINERVAGDPKTLTNPTWQATVRRVVRQYSAFAPVPPDNSGVYRLVSAPDTAPQAADLAGQLPDVDHSVAQGMLVNLGRIYGYETYVPKSDQTRREFQGRPLAESASVRDCDEVFEGPNLRKVREVDVLWFAEDDYGLYPVYAFEVEHTTKVKSGLDRLLKIPQRFNSRLFIIGPDEETAALFSRLVGQAPFREHRERFAYRLYEQLQAVHNAAVAHEDLRAVFGVRERR